jgi:crossover junction endodeoxyribonuclease RuvC
MTPRVAQAPLFAGSAPLVVLGIDPGSIRCGWGVVRKEGRQLTRVGSGWIPAKGPTWVRLATVHDGIVHVLRQYEPDLVAVEDVFVGKNPNTALKVGQARGAVLSAIGRVQTITPRRLRVWHIKHQTAKAAVAHGRADKDQVGRAVRGILRLEQTQEDEADALAVALCAAMDPGRR